MREEKRVREYLEHSIAGSPASKVLQAYLDRAICRMLITLEFMPDRPGRVLKVSSPPYLLAMLIKHSRPYELELAIISDEAVGSDSAVQSIVLDNPAFGQRRELLSRQVSIENQVFPYESESFDGVVFCEVLEHLARDPVAALAEVHRVLKPGGWLVVTTPNAAWYENIAKLWLAQNIHSSYALHSPYGRHHREYTLSELEQLLVLLGFDIERAEARDVHPGRKLSLRSRVFRALKPARFHEERLFCRAVKARSLRLVRPDWLYGVEYNDKMTIPDYVLAGVTGTLRRSSLHLPTTKPGPSRFSRRLCKLCDINDWQGEGWLSILDEMGLGHQRDPQKRHRKAWEWVYGVYGLKQLGMLHEGVNALGVGAGTEHVLYYLANHLGQVLATDIYGEGSFADSTAPREMLDHPESFAPFPYRHDHLSTRYMDGRRLDLPDNSFDVVFSFSSIEHFGGHAAAAESLCEMGRVVRPSGVVIITTELIVNGVSHQEFFLPDQIYRNLIEPSGLRLVEDVDFSLSEETLSAVTNTGHMGWEEITPHVLIRYGDIVWTSIALFLEKPAH
jgi:SAM-dependent methyltransferase